MSKINIVNIIASTRIEGSIDIETLSQKLSNATYEPEMFPGLIYRRIKPKSTIIMFLSGKISSHGAKSEDEAKQAIVTTIEEIEDIGCIIGSTKIGDINIENVVGSGDLGYELELEYIVSHLHYAMYEPDQFPGLIYRPFNDSVVCLMFSSGKVVIVGGKSENQIKKVFQDTENVLKNIVQGR